MNISTTFFFFISIVISFSIIICQPLPLWLDLSLTLRVLYSNNKNIQTWSQCAKNNDVKERFLNAFQQMGQQTTESLRQSGDGFLSIPEIITNKQIAKAVFKDIAEIQKIYEDLELIQPLCELIQKKCFFEEIPEASSSNFENEDNTILNVRSLEEMNSADCKIDGKIAFSFSVLLERFEEKSPQFTAFVYNITRFETYIELAFQACLPLMDFPDPPEVQV